MARPARSDPVNATAWVRGWRTRARLVAGSSAFSRENVPSGSPVRATARAMAPATNSEVPGCAGCPLTITGFLAAKADAVSPPATEKARGKLLAPNTTTGPSGISMRRKSGRASGLRSGNAGSIRAFTKEPSWTTPANSRNWLTVRPRSPLRRSRPSPDSRLACAINSSPSPSISAAIASRNRATVSALCWRRIGESRRRQLESTIDILGRCRVERRFEGLGPPAGRNRRIPSDPRRTDAPR